MELFFKLNQDLLPGKYLAHLHSIIVPPKVWRPQVKSEYIPPTYSNIAESLFLNIDFEKDLLVKEGPEWNHRSRTDIIIWNEKIDQKEFNKNFKTHKNTDPKLNQLIENLMDKDFIKKE